VGVIIPNRAQVLFRIALEPAARHPGAKFAMEIDPLYDLLHKNRDQLFVSHFWGFCGKPYPEYASEKD